jgi:hypothetical protein
MSKYPNRIHGLLRFPVGHLLPFGQKPSDRACLSVLVLILFLFAAAGAVHAAPITATWRPGSVGEWTDNNWDFNPGISGTLFPNNNGNTYTVNIDQPAGDEFFEDNGIPSQVNLSRAVTVDSVNLTDHLVVRNGGQLKVRDGMNVRDGCGFDCIGGGSLEVRGVGSRLDVGKGLTNDFGDTLITNGGSINVAGTYFTGGFGSPSSTLVSDGNLTADTLFLLPSHSGRVGSGAAAASSVLCPEYFGLSVCLLGRSSLDVRQVEGQTGNLSLQLGHGSSFRVRDGFSLAGFLGGDMSIGGNLDVGGDMDVGLSVDVLSGGEVNVGGSFQSNFANISSEGQATIGGSFSGFSTSIETGGVLTAQSVEAFDLVGAGRIEVNPDERVSIGGSTNPTGVLTILGNYEDGSEVFGGVGTLLIAIGGTQIDTGIDIADYDRLDVTNNAIINGRIVVSLANRFEPTAGDVFDILLAGDIIGNPVFELPTLSSGLHFVSSIVDEGGRMALRLTAVSEPSSLNLFISVCLLLAARARAVRNR